MDTIHSLFEAQVKQIPSDVAAIFEDRVITYNELNEKANQLAHYLREKGIKPDTPVALCLERSIDLLITLIAILKAGGAYVPLDSSHPKERLLFVLHDNNSPILITKSSLKGAFNHYQGSILLLDELEQDINTYSKHNPSIVATDKNLAYVIYTSGSTGSPKGVLIEHRSVINYCQWFASYCHIKPKQRIDFSANYIFDMAITTSIVPLMLGATVVICDDKTKKNTRRYLNHLKSNKIKIIKMTPSYLKVLVNEVKNSFIALPHLHTLILGGENLHTVDCASWLKHYPKHVLYNEYGPTEATVGVSTYKISLKNVHQLGTNVPIGTPGTNVRLYILGADNGVITNGEIGELFIGGVCLARGYLNQPAMTHDKFIKNPFSDDGSARLYKTGDLCRQLPNQEIEYFGRIDQQVKIHGFRVEPEEIECCIVAHPAVQDVVVLMQENMFHEKQLVAYYIPKDVNLIPGTREFRQYLEARLPSYMIPAAFVWVDSFPRTANDKLDQLALPAPQFSCSQHYVEPRSELENAIAETWSEALGVKPVGVEDNFFELGGHSLIAARIVSKLEKLTGKEITLDDFYHSPTITKLATVINYAKAIDNKRINHKINLKHSATTPLNDFQFMFWISDIVEPKVKKLNIVGRKRVQGAIDMVTLSAAFESVFKKHAILFYHTRKISPAHFIRKNQTLQVSETSLLCMSREDAELALLGSFDVLINYDQWHKRAPSIVAKLFHLQDDEIELQICMPHIVSDYTSVDVLFDDLSRFYLLHKCQVDYEHGLSQKQFQEFLASEQYDLDESLDRDITFWKSYLKDASFYSFPTSFIIEDMDAHGHSYSTYVEIPELDLSQLQQYCREKQVSITDGLCATIGSALANCCNSNHDKSKKIFMNIIKSTRDNSIYDDKIGCFLRLDAIKVDIADKPSFAAVCKRIHQSTIDTMPYQKCPGMLKLACVNGLHWKASVFTNYLVNIGIYAYTKLFRSLKLSYKLLSLYKHMISFWKDDSFFVYVNVLTNFMAAEKGKKESSLFGLETIPSKMVQYDLSKIHHVLEFCFQRDESSNKPYLVISGNIKPAVRELIGAEMIRIIQQETALIKEEDSIAFL